jgi:hypothetical protein
MRPEAKSWGEEAGAGAKAGGRSVGHGRGRGHQLFTTAAQTRSKVGISHPLTGMSGQGATGPVRPTGAAGAECTSSGNGSTPPRPTTQPESPTTSRHTASKARPEPATARRMPVRKWHRTPSQATEAAGAECTSSGNGSTPPRPTTQPESPRPAATPAPKQDQNRHHPASLPGHDIARRVEPRRPPARSALRPAASRRSDRSRRWSSPTTGRHADAARSGQPSPDMRVGAGHHRPGQARTGRQHGVRFVR